MAMRANGEFGQPPTSGGLHALKEEISLLNGTGVGWGGLVYRYFSLGKFFRFENCIDRT